MVILTGNVHDILFGYAIGVFISICMFPLLERYVGPVLNRLADRWCDWYWSRRYRGMQAEIRKELEEIRLSQREAMRDFQAKRR